MKKILLLLTILTYLNAKLIDYSIIIDKPFDSVLTDITQDYDRTITAVGFSKDYKQNSNNSNSYSDIFDYLDAQSNKFGSQMHIMKVDSKANVIVSKLIRLSKFNEAIAVVKTPNNGYFIGGYTLDGSLLVVKLDANANIIFMKSFGTKNYDRMNNLILLSDGGVLAIGSSNTSRETSDAMFNTGLGNNDIFITRFTKTGKQLWSKKYGTKYDDRGIDAVEAMDGSILVISTSSHSKNRNVNFMRLTENGNRIWLKHYIQESKDDKIIIPKKIIRLKDNNFIAVLSQYNHMQKEHIRIVKFDLYQNILIDKEIFTTYPSGINDIKEYSDGRLIAVGYVKDIYNTDGLAMILDSNLNLLTQEHYGSENYDVFNAVAILSNSQAAVAGVHTDESSQETNMWILKLNRDATMVQMSTGIDTYFDKLMYLFKDDIRDKDLVINKDLSIEFINKNLLFNTSQYKLTNLQKDFLNQFSKKLMIFLKANRESIDTLEINGHTSSEWGGASFSNAYLNNSKLSLERAYSTILYLFKIQSKNTQKWLSKMLVGSGYSYSKNITLNHIENKVQSRRVDFKIVLKEKR